MTGVPSGWYPNPHNPGEEMYWDGTSWSGAARRMSASRVEEATIARGVGTALAQSAATAVAEQTLEPASDERDFTHADWLLPVSAEADSAEDSIGKFATPALAALNDRQWYPVAAEHSVTRHTTNWFATTALILGCLGVVLTVIPFFIGIVAGGITDLLAVAFCIPGVLRGRMLGGTGIVRALVGGVLGALGLVAMTVGAGTTW